MKRTGILLILSLLSQAVFSQASLHVFDFSAENNGQPVQLNSVKAINQSTGIETIVTPPDLRMTLSLIPGDTIIFIGYSLGYQVGIPEVLRDDAAFTLSLLAPDPGSDQCRVSLSLPEAGQVVFGITDLFGRNYLQQEQYLDHGGHSFRVSAKAGNLWFLTARWNGLSRSLKFLGSGNSLNEGCRLEYAGKSNGEFPLKSSFKQGNMVKLESGILDTPTNDTHYKFQFAYNIPCPGLPTVTYEGKEYHTVQIYSQCWLKENLNVGTMLEICADQTNNGYLEKYCYADVEDSCSKYGGLYQWDEMMQYVSQQGSRGICPPGWHLPTRDEWNVLIGVVDTQFEIDDAIRDYPGVYGFDAGTNLKSSYGWAPYSFGHFEGNGTDYFGFTGLPAGYRDFFGCGNYGYVTKQGYFWSSTGKNIDQKRSIHLLNDYTNLGRIDDFKRDSYSVRCIKDID